MARRSESWKPEQSREQAAAKRLSPDKEAGLQQLVRICLHVRHQN